ncbi:MAG: type II toxin-antitoxin system PemK/MazF family toxin [Deltaproteobacteria bacterium]|nr:type II toxin-antitoxin system PemK/MazF family toxin [Deltaproteobacteria bacterium]
MTQYEIWWADLPGSAGRRPVLLLSRPSAYGYLDRVCVCEVTTISRGIPQEVRLGTREGLRRASVASLDNIQMVPTKKLSERIGALSPGRVLEVKRAVGYSFDWVELKGN